MPKRKYSFEDATGDPAEQAAVAAAVAAIPLGHGTRPQLLDVPLTKIDPNPFQARQHFGDLDELAATIRVQGFTSRLLGRPHPEYPDRVQLAYGERRLRAARLAGLLEVPLEVRPLTDPQMYEIGLAENDQRLDLHPLEQARAYQRGLDDFGLTIEALAGRIGRDRSYIHDRLAALRAPEDVQEILLERPDGLRAVREISTLDDPALRAPLVEGFIAGTINTQDVRTLAAAARDTGEVPLPPRRPPVRSRGAVAPAAALDPEEIDLEEETVGEIRISFRTEAGLQRAAKLLDKWSDGRAKIKPLRQPGRKGDWLGYGTLEIGTEE